ncbi:MAG: ABC transporter substrate-binding protein [Oscillospiraceae bacterium]|nr:ABC transporter substrate-binding protein [Oscillospiraceae bacterium]
MKRLICVLLTGMCLFCGCGKTLPESADSFPKTGSMNLTYAEQFSVDYLENGCAEINIADGAEYLLVPEGISVPEHPDTMIVLQQPLENFYVAASSAVDLFDGLNALDYVLLTSTNEQNWSLPHVKEALQSGNMLYAGKYSAPDYEMLLEKQCQIAIESTMIYHSPETKEQLETLGIPVLVERSSYEAHPLGRMEWMKLYGLLLGKEQEAETFFSEKTADFEKLSLSEIPEENKKTAAFFSINPNGYVTIHKPGDYVAQMIALAGGRYAFTAEDLHTEENALSTMNIQMEVFYETAKNCDILIYNGTIEGSLETIDQLIEKDSILSDCKAVQNGDVWCTEQSLFQQTTGVSDMIYDLHAVLTDDTENLTFLHRLQ